MQDSRFVSRSLLVIFGNHVLVNEDKFIVDIVRVVLNRMIRRNPSVNRRCGTHHTPPPGLKLNYGSGGTSGYLDADQKDTATSRGSYRK